jgi:signal transduction histidine kinase
VVTAKAPLAIEDISQEYPHFRDEMDVYESGSIRSWLGVPLQVKGQVTGMVALDREREHPYTAEEIQLAVSFASQAAIALENARLFAEVRAGHERLQGLSRRLVEIQEAERRHIARELHDQVGQALTGLKLVLEMGSRLPADLSRDSLREAQALASDLLTRVRELSLDLRPAMLDDLGLLPALLWQFERYTARTQVRVSFRQAGLERRFPADVETAVYRIVQEALTNVARHAGASEAMVRLWVDREILHLQIQDQGVGFDVKATLAAPTTGGLSGMYERVVLLGGQLTIESAPGAGACLTAELPLDQPAGHGEDE